MKKNEAVEDIRKLILENFMKQQNNLNEKHQDSNHIDLSQNNSLKHIMRQS